MINLFRFFYFKISTPITVVTIISLNDSLGLFCQAIIFKLKLTSSLNCPSKNGTSVKYNCVIALKLYYSGIIMKIPFNYITGTLISDKIVYFATHIALLFSNSKSLFRSFTPFFPFVKPRFVTYDNIKFHEIIIHLLHMLHVFDIFNINAKS